MTKVKKHELKDVEVQTVGLVSMGANQETFFLLKSEDSVMPDNDNLEEVVATETLEETEKTPQAPVLDEATLEAIREMVKSELSAAAPTPPEVLAEEVQKSEPAPEFVALQKANLELVERLEKAEKEAQEMRDIKEQQEFLAKAQAFGSLPVKADVLAEQLRWIAKSDVARLDFWAGLLTTTNALLKDSGIFAEVGTDQAPEDLDAIQTLERVVKTGTSDEIKKALLSMDGDSGQAYLSQRRAAIKTRP